MSRKTLAVLISFILLVSFAVFLVGNLNETKASSAVTLPTGVTVDLSSSGITIVNVTSGQSFVEQGFSVNLTATVDNTGSSATTFNLTFCANNFPLNTQTVTLAGQSSGAPYFDWNTTGFALGNYTLSAFAWSASEKTIVVYSYFVGGKILVTCPGDLTGHFKVDFRDLTAFVGAYIYYFRTGWCNPAADFCHTGKLNFLDVILFVAYYEEYYAGPTPFVTGGALTITLSVEKLTYSLGEPVNFTLSIKNTSKNTITIQRTASTFDFIVYNATGIMYRYSFGRVCPMWAMLYSLAPGASLAENFTWDQICNLIPCPSASPVAAGSNISVLPGSPPVFPASPGSYYIVGEALGMQTAPQEITIT